MEVINPNNTSHVIRVIPRFEPTGNYTFVLYNAYKDEDEIIPITYLYESGYMGIGFDGSFSDNTSYHITIKDDDNVVIYRGKLLVSEEYFKS